MRLLPSADLPLHFTASGRRVEAAIFQDLRPVGSADALEVLQQQLARSFRQAVQLHLGHAVLELRQELKRAELALDQRVPLVGHASLLLDLALAELAQALDHLVVDGAGVGLESPRTARGLRHDLVDLLARLTQAIGEHPELLAVGHSQAVVGEADGRLELVNEVVHVVVLVVQHGPADLRLDLQDRANAAQVGSRRALLLTRQKLQKRGGLDVHVLHESVQLRRGRAGGPRDVDRAVVRVAEAAKLDGLGRSLWTRRGSWRVEVGLADRPRTYRPGARSRTAQERSKHSSTTAALAGELDEDLRALLLQLARVVRVEQDGQGLLVEAPSFQRSHASRLHAVARAENSTLHDVRSWVLAAGLQQGHGAVDAVLERLERLERGVEVRQEARPQLVRGEAPPGALRPRDTAHVAGVFASLRRRIAGRTGDQGPQSRWDLLGLLAGEGLLLGFAVLLVGLLGAGAARHGQGLLGGGTPQVELAPLEGREARVATSRRRRARPGAGAPALPSVPIEDAGGRQQASSDGHDHPHPGELFSFEFRPDVLVRGGTGRCCIRQRRLHRR